MRKKKSILFIFLLTAVSLFGGKNISYPKSPVIPILTPWSFYVGAGGVLANTEKDPCDCARYSGRIRDQRYGSFVKIGIDFNQYIGIETSALKTYGKSAFSEILHYGLYIKPQYKINEIWNVYGLFGYGKTKITYSTPTNKCEVEKNGLSYGLGIEYNLFSPSVDNNQWKKGIRLWVDYRKLLTDEAISNTSTYVISVGVIKEF